MSANEGKKFISTGQFIISLIMMLLALGGVTVTVSSKLSAHTVQIEQNKTEVKEVKTDTKEQFNLLINKIDKLNDKLDDIKTDSRRRRTDGR